MEAIKELGRMECRRYENGHQMTAQSFIEIPFFFSLKNYLLIDQPHIGEFKLSMSEMCAHI